MVKVQRFFKRAENKPFTYPSIEERRTNPNYLGWIVGIVLIIFFSMIIYFLLK